MIEYQNLIKMSTLTNETYSVDPFKEKSYIFIHNLIGTQDMVNLKYYYGLLY